MEKLSNHLVNYNLKKPLYKIKSIIFTNKDYLFVFLIFLVPRIIPLGSDISNYDASYWYPRMDSFIKHLLEGNILKTYQQYHPGVTILFLGGMPKYVFEELFKFVYSYDPRFLSQQFIKLQIATLLPLMIILSSIGTSWYFLIKRLVNKNFAFIFSIIVSLEPFLLGTSKFVHVTGLAGFLSFSSYLFALYYVVAKKNSLVYLNISAVLMGFALLTKVDSALIMVINGFFILYKNRSDFRNLLKEGVSYGLLAFIIFYLFFPSMWVAPIKIVMKIINEGIKGTAFDSTGVETITGVKWLFYLEVFLYRSLPTTFIALLLFPYFYFRSYKTLASKKLFFNAAIASSVFLTIVLAIPDKIKDRYLFTIYPFFILLCAYTIYYLFFIVKKNNIKIFTLVILFGIYALTAYKYHPVYSYYYSDLLGGTSGVEKLGVDIKNRGEFYAQAAQYLNRNVENIGDKNVVLTNREQMRTFPPFFYGKTYSNPKLLPDGHNTDFIVSTNEFEHIIPKNYCTLVRTFGPKEPFGYNALILYECEGLYNTYKEFKN